MEEAIGEKTDEGFVAEKFIYETGGNSKDGVTTDRYKEMKGKYKEMKGKYLEMKGKRYNLKRKYNELKISCASVITTSPSTVLSSMPRIRGSPRTALILSVLYYY